LAGKSPREFLRALLDAAVGAADPARIVPPYLPDPPPGRTVIIAAGKAAAAMARAVEEHWTGPLAGLAVTRYGHTVACRHVEIIEAGHPLPDAAGRDAARRALALAEELGADDLLLCLLSGGGSALLSEPAPCVTLADKQAVTRALLRSGAPIADTNCVRKHLSAVKGGRLALAAAPARIATLIISDVAGDDAATVASGPTLADPTTLADARAMLARHSITPPEAVARHLARQENETPKSLTGGEARIIARARDALDAAGRAADAEGVPVTDLGDAVEGEARDLARAHAALARAAGPGVLISGGEATVTLGESAGRGGPNAEYLLALAVELDGDRRIHAIACDTDGIDGEGDAAGAMIGPDTLARARALGLDARAMLDVHDSYGFFSALDDLVVTGPTRTNVNDFRAILIGAGA